VEQSGQLYVRFEKVAVRQDYAAEKFIGRTRQPMRAAIAAGFYRGLTIIDVTLRGGFRPFYKAD
jgi:hypothetical protein